MRIIKEKNMAHEIFGKMEASENTLGIYRCEDPQGYFYINKNEEKFSIQIHCLSELPVSDQLKGILAPYLRGKAYVSVSAVNTALIGYLRSTGQTEWYGMYTMSLAGQVKPMTKGALRPYHGELDLYIDIFGRCFEPMRKLNKFEPHDWYKANREKAKKEFEEADKDGNFYGYVIDGQIVGGGIVDGHELDVLAIKPEQQCRGLGRQLLRGIVSEMVKNNPVVTIGVVETNQHVLKLYMSEGFKIERHEKRFRNF